MTPPDRSELQPLAVREIAYRDPLTTFAALADWPYAVFLDSAQVLERLGRYSFIAADPFRTLVSKDGRCTLDGRAVDGDPLDILSEQLARYPIAAQPELPPFQGGAAGLFSYDLGRRLETLPPPRLDDMGFPDLAVAFYDTVVAFDHHKEQAWILASGYPAEESADRRARAEARIEQFQDAILSIDNNGIKSLAEKSSEINIQANFTPGAYQTAVQRVIDYILAGDIFQANLSQRFEADLPAGWSGFDLYQQLRRINPAPFAAYLKFAETEIVSSSPERFLKVRDRRVETRPIKGTRPRGATAAEDDRLALELLASEKDRAENVMIVDLLRNDLSRVCRDDSVQVPELCVLETYPTVYHLVSTVVGELAPNRSAVDLLRACFPGGSITGAPKIRAMEIIAELEPTQRGPYCGAIGYLGFDGAMDSNILIRTYAIKDRRVTFQAGGGIVADSDPAAEYQETLDKARALREALAPGGGAS